MPTREFYGRTLARSQALQLLFQAEATNRSVAEVLDGDFAISQGPLDPYAEELARGCDEVRSDLDAVITVTSTNWGLMRMPAVDRNLLRLALYEIFHSDEVALAVTIDEVVELAKAYGTDESSRFVNGLLGKVARNMDAGMDVIADARERYAQIEAERREREAAREAERLAHAGDDVADDYDEYDDYDEPYYDDDEDDGFEPYSYADDFDGDEPFAKTDEPAE